MNSTYKLIGAHWDGLPQVDEMPPSVPRNSETLFLGVPRNLFDIGCCRRAASLLRILSCASFEEVDAYLTLGDECEEIVLLVDFRPRTSGKATNAFFEKRLCQVVSHIETVLPRARILLMEGADSKNALFRGKGAA